MKKLALFYSKQLYLTTNVIHPLFLRQDNKPASITAVTKKSAKLPALTGYISTTGKLVFPIKTWQVITKSGPVQRMRVGTQTNKRTLSKLHLIPTDKHDDHGFPLAAAAKGSTIKLDRILQDGQIDYKHDKYRFTLVPFSYQAGEIGYMVQLTSQADKLKVPYMGKRRGYKPRVSS